MSAPPWNEGVCLEDRFGGLGAIRRGLFRAQEDRPKRNALSRSLAIEKAGARDAPQPSFRKSLLDDRRRARLDPSRSIRAQDGTPRFLGRETLEKPTVIHSITDNRANARV